MKPIWTKYAFILFFLISFSLIAQTNYNCEKWDVLDIPFFHKNKTDKPFEVNFGAIFVHESGKSINIPAFYNGDNTWVLRFSSSLEGKWLYQTWSSLPQLAGKSGQIDVRPNTKNDEHGPLTIPPQNRQRFCYADGTPYFLMAFEMDWIFALDWDNPADIPKTKEIISEVKKNGFNQIIMNVYAYDAGWGDREKIRPEHNYAKPKVFPFAGNNENPDYRTLNIHFFKHLDRVIAHLDEQEILAHLMIYVWNKQVNWPPPESKADNLYFDYVVKRYQAYPNLIWDISKEALAYGRDDMGYITRRIDRLRKLDGHERLLSVHDYGYCSAFPEKVDFISIQSWRPNLYNSMQEVARKHPEKPIFNIEHGGYETTMHFIFHGAYSDPITCLDRNYQCVFAGTYSTYYWQNTSWYELVYNPASLPAAMQPNFVWYKYLVDLFQKYDFNRLQPVQYGTLCLTDHQSVYLFYIPTNMDALTGDVAELKGKTVIAKWFDPITGKFSGSEKRELAGGTWLNFQKDKEFSAPFSVVILEIQE
ncbi:DUF4038 domain-containing protein [candidate division KSB1 bacterium]|nr:DUF4038 domain-containing protein [candidate division KSB1 bacterium]